MRQNSEQGNPPAESSKTTGWTCQPEKRICLIGRDTLDLPVVILLSSKFKSQALAPGTSEKATAEQ